MRGLDVRARGLDILKFDKNSTDLVFYIAIWGDWSLVWGDKPTKALPVETGLWRSSSQPTPFITYEQVLKGNSWK